MTDSVDCYQFKSSVMTTYHGMDCAVCRVTQLREQSDPLDLWETIIALDHVLADKEQITRFFLAADDDV